MNRQHLIKLTADLIRFPSIKEDEKSRKAIISFVKNYFKGEKVHITTFERKGVYSVVVTLKKEKNPTLLFNGHLDVVPAKKEQFSPRVKNNRIYGRGSGDMKGAAAVMMAALKELSRRKEKPSVGLMLTTDEEVGGLHGVGYLVNQKKYRSKYVVIPDGGKDLRHIVTKQKGVLHLAVKAQGKSAHGARPWLGENSIEKLLEYYKTIRSVIPFSDGKQWKTTLNLGKIVGGEHTNSVPAEAAMHLDVRFIDKKEKKSLVKKISNITHGNVEVIVEADPFIQSDKDPFVKTYLAVASRQAGRLVSVDKIEGASDARFFSAHGSSVVITKINCADIHGDDEWIDIDAMELFYKILITLVAEVNC